MTSEFSETDVPKKSKYNSAVAQLYRMDDLWKDAHRHSRLGNYEGWNYDLDRIWMELSGDATSKEKETLESFNKRLLLIGVNINLTNNNFEGIPYLYNRIRLKQYQILMEKEIFLRKLQNQQGKGAAYEDDIADYMD